MVTIKHRSFVEFETAENTPGLQGCSATQVMCMYRQAAQFDTTTILELGVEKGSSATVFLEACDEKDGHLVSVDIRDCSGISDSDRWQFVKSDSAYADFIISEAPVLGNGIDILYIDSLHVLAHVKKEFENWWPYMNQNS